MAHPATTKGHALHTENHVIKSKFDSLKQLRHTLDHTALAESLFGSSELSPLSTPEPTPQSSPILQANMDIDEDGDGDGDRYLTHLNSTHLISKIFIPLAPSSILTTHTRQAHPETSAQAPSSTQSAHATGAEHRKAKKKAQSHANRQKARQVAREATYANLKVRPECTAKFVHSSTPVLTDTDTKNASRVSTGYTGRDSGDRSSKLYTLDELIGEGSKFGFKLQKWDGR